MNKLTRVLAMTGMAMVAGATIGAGPASAAPAAPASTTHGADHWSPGHDQVIDYYRNPFDCNRAGHLGERHNRWDRHECNQVRGGFRRGWWALIVSWDHHGHDQHGHDQHGHDQHGHDDSHDQHGHHGHNH